MYDALLEHHYKKVDLSVQSYQTVATLSGQQANKLARLTVQVSMLDLKPGHVMAMILPWCSLGFFPGMEPFTNGGSVSNGQPVQDRSRYWSMVGELK